MPIDIKQKKQAARSKCVACFYVVPEKPISLRPAPI